MQLLKQTVETANTSISDMLLSMQNILFKATEEIAFQTNLLALNAAIHVKGFVDELAKVF